MMILPSCRLGSQVAGKRSSECRELPDRNGMPHVTVECAKRPGHSAESEVCFARKVTSEPGSTCLSLGVVVKRGEGDAKVIAQRQRYLQQVMRLSTLRAMSKYFMGLSFETFGAGLGKEKQKEAVC